MPYSLVLRAKKDHHFQWQDSHSHQSLQNNTTKGIHDDTPHRYYLIINNDIWYIRNCIITNPQNRNYPQKHKRFYTAGKINDTLKEPSRGKEDSGTAVQSLRIKYECCLCVWHICHRNHSTHSSPQILASEGD